MDSLQTRKEEGISEPIKAKRLMNYRLLKEIYIFS